jgi:hypothetical protein
MQPTQNTIALLAAFRNENYFLPKGIDMQNIDLSHEENDTPFVVEKNNEIASCALGKHISNSILKLRQVTTKQDAELETIEQLIQQAEVFAKSKHYSQIIATTDTRFKSVFEQQGFVFLEEMQGQFGAICKMEKQI